MAVKFSPETKAMLDAASLPRSAFGHSWSAIAPSLGASKTWYTDAKGVRKVAGGSVRLQLEVLPDPQFKAFMRRLDRMPSVIKKEAKRMLRAAVREEILPRLRRNIPQSPKRKKHLRATAKIMEMDIYRAVIGVGDADRWYAGVLHAGGTNRIRRRRPYTGSPTGTARPVPFFPRTFKEATGPLSDRLLRDVSEMLAYLDSGHIRRRFG